MFFLYVVSVVFGPLAAPGSTYFQAAQRSSAVQFVLCQDAPGLPRMPTKTALGVRMKFALGLCPCVLHTEFRVPHCSALKPYQLGNVFGVCGSFLLGTLG